jgi:methanogenic corrinoid protein MtbC1
LTRQYLAENNSIKDLYEEVFKSALYEVGSLWETNKITVATEHLATAIVEGILNELFEQIFSDKKLNKKVVVACVENEKHQVGIKMVADLFEMKGWESFFLGAGIPTPELIRFIREVEPDLLAISLSVYFNFKVLVQMVEKIKVDFPYLPILLGGQAFNHISRSVEKLGQALC